MSRELFVETVDAIRRFIKYIVSVPEDKTDLLEYVKVQECAIALIDNLYCLFPQSSKIVIDDYIWGSSDISSAIELWGIVCGDVLCENYFN